MKTDRSSCECEKCRECCTREPGWFLPEEISITANYLGMSEHDFIENFCTEHELDDAIVLSPATKTTSTTCIFFEKGKCRIHPVKPYECRKVFGCEPPRRHARMRELIARQWR